MRDHVTIGPQAVPKIDGVSPLSRRGLTPGKRVPHLCISMIMATFLFAIPHGVFFVPIRGSLLALFVSAFFCIFARADVAWRRSNPVARGCDNSARRRVGFTLRRAIQAEDYPGVGSYGSSFTL